MTEFEAFCAGVLSLMTSEAQQKKYNDKGIEGDNPLLNFSHAFFPGHALGEVVYKAVRYQAKHDPTDLMKIAAWAFLEWKKR